MAANPVDAKYGAGAARRRAARQATLSAMGLPTDVRNLHPRTIRRLQRSGSGLTQGFGFEALHPKGDYSLRAQNAGPGNTPPGLSPRSSTPLGHAPQVRPGDALPLKGGPAGGRPQLTAELLSKIAAKRQKRRKGGPAGGKPVMPTGGRMPTYGTSRSSQGGLVR